MRALFAIYSFIRQLVTNAASEPVTLFRFDDSQQLDETVTSKQGSTMSEAILT